MKGPKKGEEQHTPMTVESLFGVGELLWSLFDSPSSDDDDDDGDDDDDDDDDVIDTEGEEVD